MTRQSMIEMIIFDKLIITRELFWLEKEFEIVIQKKYVRDLPYNWLFKGFDNIFAITIDICSSNKDDINWSKNIVG